MSHGNQSLATCPSGVEGRYIWQNAFTAFRYFENSTWHHRHLLRYRRRNAQSGLRRVETGCISDRRRTVTFEPDEADAALDGEDVLPPA